MRVVNIAMTLVVQADLYHLQRRNGDKAIGAAGLVGCFGGKIESGETAQEAAARELAEETNIQADADSLRLIESFDVESDHQLKPIKVHVKVVEMHLPHGQKVSAKEGELVSWTVLEIKENEDQLTPATKELFKRYLA